MLVVLQWNDGRYISRCTDQNAVCHRKAKSGLPISSFMDRSNPKELQCQSSFLQYIVGPLYAVGKRIWPDMSSPAAQLEANKQDLENRAEKAARAAKAAKKAKAS